MIFNSFLFLRLKIEKLEIEDEYERLLEELKLSESEILVAEKSLEKVNDIGNILETKANTLQQQVEALEKTRDALTSERTDVNNKVRLAIFTRMHFVTCLSAADDY